MEQEGLQRQLADKIGKNFNLVFNQVSMYNVYHKSVQGSLERAMESLQEGFDNQATITISLHQEQGAVKQQSHRCAWSSRRGGTAGPDNVAIVNR